MVPKATNCHVMLHVRKNWREMAGQVSVSFGDDGTVYKLEVDFSEDIGRLKETFLQRHSVGGPTEQEFALLHGESRLEDSRSLSSYGLSPGAVLQLVRLLEIQVSRKDGEPAIALQMLGSESVGHLKVKISEQCHLPVCTLHIKQTARTLTDEICFHALQILNSSRVELHLDIRLRVNIEVFNGLAIPLEVSSDDLVDTIHAAVNQRTQIPYHHQEVTYEGRVMELGQRVCDYGVTDGAILRVDLRDHEVMVFVKTLTGKTIMLAVTPRDTVAQVKAKIAQQEDIPIGKQRLIFVGEQLHDDHRLLDYRIEHESAVHLVIREGESFEIYVRGPSGRTYVYEMSPTDTLERLSDRLAHNEGIPSELQQFHLGEELLDVHHSLSDNGVTAGSTLQLAVDRERTTQIFVSLPSQDTIPLWASPGQTIFSLKEMIAKKQNIAPELQELYFARVLLEDGKTLEDYTIESNHMLHLNYVRVPVVQFSITVQGSTNGPIECDIPANHTVQDIKQSISGRVGLSIYQQQLFLGGSELENGHRLSECGIADGTDLHLVPSYAEGPFGLGEGERRDGSKCVLFIKTLAGKTIMVTLAPTDTVLDIKKKIQAQEGVAVEHQCLVCGGRVLENTMTICDCGVQNMSMLHLVLRVPSKAPVDVVVEAEGSTYTLEVMDDDTVNGLKEEIENKTGISTAHQVLVLAGEVLDEMEPLSTYNLEEGTVIQVQRND